MSDISSRLRTSIPDLVATMIPGPVRREGHNLVCAVPWRLDRNPSLKIHAEDGRWRDWGRGTGGGFLALVQRVRGLDSEAAAARWLEDQGHLRPDRSACPIPTARPTKTPLAGSSVEAAPSPQSSPPATDKGTGDALDRWAALRGFTRDSLLAIGARSKGGLVEIPMRTAAGTITGWRLRRADGGPVVGKSKAATNRDGDLGLIGTWPIPPGGPLLVCEGETDALAVLSAWPEAAVVALPGASPGDEVLAMLREVASERETVLIFDNDKAGELGARKALAKVPHARIGVVHPGFKDIDAMLCSLTDPAARLAAIENIVAEAAKSPSTRLRTPKVTSSEDLMKNPPDPVDWLVPNLLPAVGLFILSGPPKSGKSFLALSLCWTIAAGGNLFGSQNLKANNGKVLGLFLEDSERRLYSRIELMKDHLQTTTVPSMLFMFEAPKISDGLEASILSAIGERIQGEKAFVVIDILAKVQSVDSGRGNAYRMDTEEIGLLQSIAQRNKLCILVLTHNRKAPPKGEESDPIASITGTTGISGAADGLFVLRRKRESATGKLYAVGREFGEQSFELRFDAGLWVLGDPEPPPDHDRELVQLFGDRASFTTDDAVEVLGLPRDVVRKRLQRAVDRGTLLRVAAGQFRLSGEGV